VRDFVSQLRILWNAGIHTLELPSWNACLEHLVKLSWSASLGFREAKVGDDDAAEHPAREEQVSLRTQFASIKNELIRPPYTVSN
jgi:hypothetical protein